MQGLCQAAQVEDARNFYYTGHGCPSDATTRQRSRQVGTLQRSTTSEFLELGFERFGVKGLAPGPFSKNILKNGRSVANMDLMELGPHATTQEGCPCKNAEPLWTPSVSPSGADTSACTCESCTCLYAEGFTMQSNILSFSLQIIYTNSRHF